MVSLFGEVLSQLLHHDQAMCTSVLFALDRHSRQCLVLYPTMVPPKHIYEDVMNWTMDAWL